MICLYCNSRVSPVPDNGVCPHCGCVLDKPKFPDPPIGKYKDAAGYVEIGEKNVTFCRKHFFKAHKKAVPYSEIYAVAYQPGKPFESGYLCIRQWQDRHLPMPAEVQDVIWDPTGVYFAQHRNAQFHKVYIFLRQCADIACRANASWQKDENTLCGKDPQNDSVELPAFPECLKPLEEGSEEQKLAERRRVLRASGQVYCPHCLSTSFTVDNQQPSMRYIPFRSPLAALFRLMRELLFLTNHAINGDMCVCLRCGGTWFSKRWELGERHVELVSRYLGVYPQLELAGADGASLLLTRSQVSLQFPEKKGCVIPLRELAHADLRKSNGLPYGQLTLRIKANKMRPLPRSVDDARKENYSIVYTEDLQESFTQVYAVLMAIIEENKKAGLIS